jgi:hypothetical protein
VGSREAYKLLENLIATLQGKGNYNLASTTSLEFSSRWHQECKKVDYPGLEGIKGVMWEAYTMKFKVSHVKIKDIKDELV